MPEAVSRAVVIVALLASMVAVYALVSANSAGGIAATGKMEVKRPPQFAGTLTEGGNI